MAQMSPTTTDVAITIRTENLMDVPANLKCPVAVSLVALLCACGSVPPHGPGRQVSSADKWVGHTVDELIVANGEPLNVHRLNAGGRMFEYTVESAGNSAPVRAQKNSSRKGGSSPCKLLFVISASDIVESWKVEGDKCN